MTLTKYIESLPRENRYRLAIAMLLEAIPVWEKYADNNKLTYHDSVVWLKHKVERTLLSETLESVEIKVNSEKKNTPPDESMLALMDKFEDPIIALQDDDWKLPEEVQITFYSAYNLLQSVISGDDAQMYVSVNQSIDALNISKTLTEEEIKTILESFKE